MSSSLTNVVLAVLLASLFGGAAAVLAQDNPDPPSDVAWSATLSPVKFTNSFNHGYHESSNQGTLEPNHFDINEARYTVTQLSRESNTGAAADLTMYIAGQPALAAADWQLIVGDGETAVVLNLSGADVTASGTNVNIYKFRDVTMAVWDESVPVKLAQTKPLVSVRALADSITEGDRAQFEVSADPAPEA